MINSNPNAKENDVLNNLDLDLLLTTKQKRLTYWKEILLNITNSTNKVKFDELLSDYYKSLYVLASTNSNNLDGNEIIQQVAKLENLERELEDLENQSRLLG